MVTSHDAPPRRRNPARSGTPGRALPGVDADAEGTGRRDAPRHRTPCRSPAKRWPRGRAIDPSLRRCLSSTPPSPKDRPLHHPRVLVSCLRRRHARQEDIDARPWQNLGICVAIRQHHAPLRCRRPEDDCGVAGARGLPRGLRRDRRLVPPGGYSRLPMPFDRRFCQLVGCDLPLQLASLGGRIGTPVLAAAVASAGGLGMIPNPLAGGSRTLCGSSARPD